MCVGVACVSGTGDTNQMSSQVSKAKVLTVGEVCEESMVCYFGRPSWLTNITSVYPILVCSGVVFVGRVAGPRCINRWSHIILQLDNEYRIRECKASSNALGAGHEQSSIKTKGFFLVCIHEGNSQE